MAFWSKWFSFWKKKTEYADEPGRETEEPVLSRSTISVRDGMQRERFIKSCLEQIRDAENEIADLSAEYGQVTSYLTDMEEIEALPPEEKKEITEAAEKISAYVRERDDYEERPDRMSDARFHQMERLSHEAQEGIRKLEEAEAYQAMVKSDLGKLAGERHAFGYRKNELRHSIQNLRGMLIICCFAFVTCLILLYLLQTYLRMETGIGYMLTGAVIAISVFVIYMRYTDNTKELRMVEKTINKLILLQNRVKIRYVNNTNLLDYLYTKYKVSDAAELREIWDSYNREKEERERLKELHAELAELHTKLMKALRECRVRDPEIWLNQTEALINRNEMVEIRHNLIQQRQKLRKQMEYNERLAEHAQSEIRSFAEDYPAYKAEIMDLVDEFERQQNT